MNRADWKALGLSPVRSDAPCGESIRYDPVFDEIQSEVQKLETVSGRPVDWKKVVRVGQEILAGKSKDLLVSSYLCLGLFDQEGYPGLLNGLTCMKAMVAEHWAGLFPETKRMRGRINALTWLAEKAGGAVSRKPPAGTEGGILRACLEELTDLEKILEEKLGPEGPGLGAVRIPIQEHLAKLEAVDDAGTTSAARPDGATASGVKSTVPSAAALELEQLQTARDAERLLREAEPWIRRIALAAQRLDPALAWPYRVVRLLAWLHLDALPPSQAGRTRIPPPDSRIEAQLEGLMQQQAWTDLIGQVEAKLHESPFWLDLQWFSLQALGQMGPAADRARETVAAELRCFLDRLPGVLDLQFSNGKPLADARSRACFEQVVLRAPAGHDAGQADRGRDRSDSLVELCQNARGLIARGDLKGAIQLMQENLSRAGAHRERFLIRLELARICLETGQLGLALSQLEMLEQDIGRFNLESWEPDLTLSALRLLHGCLSRVIQESRQTQPEFAKRAEEIHRWISRIDPVGALELETKKKAGLFGR